MSLQDRIALVTGGGRGIGRAIAVALARAGAHVAVGFRERRSEAEAVAAEVRATGRRACVVGGDVADEREVARVVEETRKALGDIDVLAANAGVGAVASLDELDLATFDRTMAVNLRSAFLLENGFVTGQTLQVNGGAYFT